MCSDLLAKLTDPEPVTAEWLESEGWVSKQWRTHIYFTTSSVVIGLFLHCRNQEIVAYKNSDFLIEIETRGQLACLIRGLGGEV